MPRQQKKKGVTLVELLIVVFILAALAAIAIPRLSQSATTAKVEACKANIALLNSAIERYYAINGAFPATLGVVKRDKTYFPDGKPVCPITGEKYIGLNDKKRVKMNQHNH